MGDVVLGGIPGVELMQAGTWPLSTGTFTFTAEDLAAAVSALDCPAVRRPVLKLGHTDPRFDGEPACGWVAGMRVADDGYTLVGDFEGMPQWLVDVAASAYPDRSVEGAYDFRCQLGHQHPFVLTGVALLGVTPPGVGTLESLQDVATLYGVEVGASAEGDLRTFALTVKGAAVPQPVAAAVSVEDVRRAFNEQAPWSVWIIEVSLDPLELIVCNDEDSTYSRVPFTATDPITFGQPVKVVRQYVDAPATEDPEPQGLAALASARVVYASRDESRAQVPSATVAAGSEKGAGMDPAKLRDALGLAADASDVEVQAALAAAGMTAPAVTDTPAPPAPTLTLPEGVVAIDAETLEGLKVAASAGVRADQRLAEQDRDNAISAAVQAGKIPPARRAHFEASWAADPEGTRATLESLAPGLVPVQASGYLGDTDTADLDSEYAALFGAPSKES